MIKMKTKKIEKTKILMGAIMGKWKTWYRLNLSGEYKNRYDLNFLFLYYRIFDWFSKKYFLDNVNIEEIKKVYNGMIKDRKQWHILNSKIKRYYRNRPAGFYNQKFLKRNGIIESTTSGVRGDTKEAQT